jgi:hypothetical protein
MMASLFGLSSSSAHKKKQRNDDEPPGSPSSVAPKGKKGKEMTTSQGGSLSFATPEKNVEDADELGGAQLIVISWVFSQM